MKVAHATEVIGLNGVDLFQFSASVKSGRGRERVCITVEPATIRALANALLHTPSVGHAAYHVAHPDLPLPCSSCEPGLTDAFILPTSAPDPVTGEPVAVVCAEDCRPFVDLLVESQERMSKDWIARRDALLNKFRAPASAPDEPLISIESK